MIIRIAILFATALFYAQIASSAESEVYYDNEVHTCKSSEYFDVDYLKCKKCELNLIPSKDSE